MRRRLAPYLYLLTVAALVFAGDRLGGLVLGRIVDASQFRMSRLYHGTAAADILAIGDSRGVHSVYAPDLGRMTCMSVFNAAFNGMSAEIAEAVVEDYLAHNPAPKAVLIEISNVGDQPDLLKEMRLYAREPGHVRDLLARLDPRDLFWSRVAHLYAFNNEMALRALYYERRSDQDWILHTTVTPDAIAHAKSADYAGWRPSRANVASIARLAGELKARGIKPILFIAPYHPAHEKLAPQFRADIAALQRELGPGLPILDLSERLSGDADFADVLHPNLRGAEKVAALLEPALRDLGGTQHVSTCGSAPAQATPPTRSAAMLSREP